MRSDLARLAFEIDARDHGARRGRLLTAHGMVQTPAFIPLATKGAVRTLASADVAGLGFELILGNTFHLFLAPGAERIAELGGLHRFMGWDRALITDSGGFQVFSLAHGNVADEVKGRRGGAGGSGGVVEISERGVRFRSYLDGSHRFMGPEESMAVQAALASDIALAFDECTPFHADREYTARSTERTHRWLDRCLEWRECHASPGQLFLGIVQGGVHRDLRVASAERIAAAEGIDGVAIGGSLGQEKSQMREVVGWALDALPDRLPRHLLGIGDVDDVVHAVGAGIDWLDCATPTRLARHGTALVPDPEARWRLDVTRPPSRSSREPLARGCPCPACREHTRAYLHYLARAKELTAVRLLTLHNLTFMAKLVEGLREAIREGCLAEHARAILKGRGPYAAENGRAADGP